MTKLRDKVWLWGHPEGRYNFDYGNTGISRMTPMEGALYLNARNMFMVPCRWNVDWRQYNKSFVTLDNVGWCIDNAAVDDALLNKLMEEAKDFPNITCAVFDDFKRLATIRSTPLKPEKFVEIRERLHTNPVREMDMWMVLYTYEYGIDEQVDKDFQPFIDAFDGVIMWTWKESELNEFDEKYELFKKFTEGKKRMIGLYLYNFGERKKASGLKVLWQLERYTELMRAGEIDGIVLHTNTMADLDHEAYDVARSWMLLHGDDEI